MKRTTTDSAAIKRAAERSTRASAQLERRVVPKGFVRSERAEKYLTERRKTVG